MLMRINVNNDVNKDSPILALRLKATYERKCVFRVSVCGFCNGWFESSYS